jgi:D-arabinose 1-dehydrogenase-like Zn-dependent alcohol dehydrogenase
MAKMRAVQVARPNGPLELVERDIPDPGPGEVRIKVETCGICHADTTPKRACLRAFVRADRIDAADDLVTRHPWMNEIFSLERAAKGYEHMMSGRARFRVVLTTGN